MNEVEKHTLSVEDQKTKIRQRYKGIDTDLIRSEEHTSELQSP